MYIKRTTKRHRGKTYHNYLLVEAVATFKGPRHKVICSLGDLSPRPKSEWLALTRKLEAALTGQIPLHGVDSEVDVLMAKARASQRKTRGRQPPKPDDDLVAVHVDRVLMENCREAGSVHVGHQVWKRLGVDRILQGVGLSPRARLITEVMTLNRLIRPASEHAMPDWIRQTALGDVLETEFASLSDESLYRHLDRLYPNRKRIETALARREAHLFNLDDTYYLYDLTSTYFEGQCLQNPKAKRGYSRDHRPDCKQVVIGLVLDRDGFPKAHEIFEGNRQDRTTLDEMLDALERRSGRRGGATVIVDRGMAYQGNLQQIKARHHHYLVAGLPTERNQWLAQLESEEGWEEVVRMPSPRNPYQKKTKVWVKREVRGDEVYVLCRGEGRVQKDRAIREKKEQKLLADIAKLQARVAAGRLKDPPKINQVIGRLMERYPRVARYYKLSYNASTKEISCVEDSEKKDKACKVDGAYLLKTDRTDLSGDELWRLYILLTRVEDAFRDLKSPLSERPIFHHLERRVETHIFLCVLAYHLMVCIEKAFTDQGIHTSWATLRQQLKTHQVATMVLPTSDGRTLTIRKGSKPESEHCDIYRILGISDEVMRPVKSWIDLPK